MRYCIRRYETDDWNKHAKNGPAPAFALEIAKEAGPYGVSDSEKKQ